MPPPPPRSRAALAVVVAAVLLIVAANPQRSAAAHGPGDGVASCTGTVGECVDDGAVARRELGGNGYIGYGAMGAGNVPCSYRGASYYNCRPSGAANPYSRGCSAITQCRG
ncbi:rapid alkalinization factor-like [Panicum miliaceum]|uniref:Rapid alkalinization factor-like n=1 Tax=Panicum miliaceum TaxID=4540 RepID=A0A3L6PPD6_PANMI|nr:rapid alkalinization factor-like [Panicum miliaceum]